MKKRSALLFLMACALIVWLSGSISFAAPIEINYYMWQDPTYQSIVDAFNASQKEIVVKPVIVPSADYETKIVTMLAGGADIDCYMQKRQTDMFPQNKNGFIEPLNSYIKSAKYDMKSIKAYAPQITVKGKVLAIPFRGAGYYTYYNKKLFAKAGIPTPDQYVKKGEWTWNKFAEVSKKLASGDGKVYGGLLYTWPMLSVLPVVQKNNQFINAKGKVDIDSKVLAYSVKMRRDLEKSKAIISASELKATKMHYSKGFYDGNVGMLIIGEWFPGMMVAGRDQKLLKDYGWNDWAITRMPCNQSKYVTVGACTFNHIYSRSKKKAAAFKFISWMGSSEGAKVVARNGFLPPVVDAGVKAELAKVVPDTESLNALIDPAPRIAPWYSELGSQVEATLNVELDKYLATDMPETTFVNQFRAQLKQLAESNR
ncbi:multiple sugar transport system substrate-binding protein [Hydrogenispora ethanolica]|jgi:multiple sugar transport system substrate-binding protein|uniref:Multiple sugar transport system substrate-binding protein n=1 Tax=Hydrogenispora ethanolica TaxID=1082276 RepID=A0A4R1R929_HYDET|nr:extracellular solute-binding protein [Hydrogenispora ethanolica]TCL62069.1 multiple sugar transport system substrate-binding protein [Hydrogenispora ethanolica]